MNVTDEEETRDDEETRDENSRIPTIDRELEYRGNSEVTINYLDFGGNILETESSLIPNTIVLIKPAIGVNQYETETNPFNLLISAGVSEAGANEVGAYFLQSASIHLTPSGRRVLIQGWNYEVMQNGVVHGSFENPSGLEFSAITALSYMIPNMPMSSWFGMREDTEIEIRFPSDDEIEVRITGVSTDETIAFDISMTGTLQ
jgi:hypothetical protein